MLISLNWLKKYLPSLPSNLKPLEVAERLKLSTVEVERMVSLSETLKEIVVGRILTIQKHPQADKLKVCQVEIKKERRQIVCGGSNLREGMLVAVALPGAEVRWHGMENFCQINETEIRGVRSFGMICAAEEIGLEKLFPPKEEREIIDLSPLKLKIGISLASALGFDDSIFEIDNKSLNHRPDLWGHYGLAREIAALFNLRLSPYKTLVFREGKGFPLSVKIKEKKLCPRYLAVAIEGVVITESPFWLKRDLLAVGLRPINNLVDITNYVMLDLGQPIHAFDASLVKKGRIVVRRAREGEELTTLESKTKKLDSSMLVIADEEKSIALAGIIGGINSAISEKTTRVIFEAANFEPSNIRQTSLKLGIRTDASSRFEKGLDPYLGELALRKAVELTLQLCPQAKVVSRVIDESFFKLNQGPLQLSSEFFEKKAGFKIEEKAMSDILKRLGFGVEKRKKYFLVKIPSWRATGDVSRPEDLVEEIIRIYGYEKIPAQLPSLPIAPWKRNELRCLERLIEDTLVKELAYDEVYNYSFVSEKQIRKIGDEIGKYLELDNPISKEKPFLRRYLINNLIENIIKNIEFYPEVRLFEIGKTFRKEESGPEVNSSSKERLPRQDTWLTTVYANKKDKEPFWQARRVMERIGQILRLPFELRPVKDFKKWYHPWRSGEIFCQNQKLGVVYEIHPRVAKELGLETRVSVLELNLNQLVQLGQGKIVYKLISPFPEIQRDLAIIVKKEITYPEVVERILAISPLIKKVELFDSYFGERIKQGYKSLAFHLVFGSDERTLTSQEVDEIIEKVVKNLKDKLGAEWRVS
jgi:phenylalanyl-tRNA synthetase beta chain